MAQDTNYLEAKILTAPPHRLHLMLIEGAIRFGRQAEEALRRGEQVAAAPALLRVLDIVGELLAGVRERKSALNQKLSELYLYLFCRASLAKLNGDADILAEVLRILEFERETWQMACEKIAAEPKPASAQVSKSANLRPTSVAAQGFSLEA
jgi:flagellar secretion chaperone FliS